MVTRQLMHSISSVYIQHFLKNRIFINKYFLFFKPTLLSRLNLSQENKVSFKSEKILLSRLSTLLTQLTT